MTAAAAPPKVAVVITCFNLGAFLDEAVESVLRQTFQDFEIVVVDDGSTDPATKRLLDGYTRPKTRVIRCAENRGLSAARNLGIHATASPYVTTLDADDRFLPAMLERSVEALDRDPGLSFASHWLRTFGDESWEWKPASCDLTAMVDANAINGAALMRRACFDAVGGFDEQMRDGCEDWDFWLSALEAGQRGTIIPEILYEYRRRPDSMSRLMMEEDRHARLYAQIAAKHRASFLPHLPHLLARRERDIVNFRTHIHALEREHLMWLVPEVSARRDDVETVSRRVQREEAAEQERLSAEESAARRADERLAQLQAAHDAAMARTDADIAGLRAEHEQLRVAASKDAEVLADARDRVALVEARLREAETAVAERDHGAQQLERDIAALKHSLSWRITAPLRAIGRWLGIRARSTR